MVARHINNDWISVIQMYGLIEVECNVMMKLTNKFNISQRGYN